MPEKQASIAVFLLIGEISRLNDRNGRTDRRTGPCLTKKGANNVRAFQEPDTRHNRYRCFLSDLTGLAA